MNLENPKTPEEIIIKATCLYFGLNPDSFVKDPSTDQDSSYKRFLCVYLLREKTLLSYDRIAGLICRKASSVKNAYKTISGLEAIKDRRTLADLTEIKLIIDNFTSEKKQAYA